MKIIHVENERMTGKEALELAKQDNDYRGGEYRIPYDGRHKTYYIVQYVGYANPGGGPYGNRYEKQWKIIFNPTLYRELCKSYFG